MKSAIIEAAEELERQAAGLFDCGDGEAYKARLLSLAQRLRAKANQPIRLGPDRWAKEASFRPESSSPAIPDGWRLVPVEPTYEMQRALHGIYGEARRRWSAALGVAPTPPGVNESLTTGWVRTTDRLPKMGEGIRVLIYTEGHDFGGEQYFDVLADDLNECAFPDPEQQPEVCRYATHWMPMPAPPASEDSTSVEKSSVIRAPQRGGG